MKRRLLKIGLPAILVAVFLLILAGWWVNDYYSLDARFARSRQALDAYAARVTASSPGALAALPARLGDFEASNTEPLPHGFLFRADYGGMFDWSGLAYSTEPLPHQAGHDYFKHIEGYWYTVDRN